jgi:predicted RNA binding protein YcfA (HicA-like mRNA interferase family)
MSLTPNDIVVYLDREGALSTPAASPGPRVDEAAEAHNVDLSRLFPTARPLPDGEDWDLFGDQWDPSLPTGLDEQIADRAASGASRGKASRADQPDVCAWYQPLHFHGLDWGIFIREDCLLRLAVEISAFLPMRPRGPSTLLTKALIRAAFATLFLHEAYHHKTESLGIRLHVVERAGCYVPYFATVYDPLRAAGSDDLHEEALANAESYLRLHEVAYRRWLSPPVYDAARAYLRWRFPLDPPGYRMATSYLTEDAFDTCEYLLKSQIQEKVQKPFRTTSDWQLSPRINQSLFTCRSDIWTIVAPGAAPVLPVGPPYPSISTTAMTKSLGKLGYTVVRGGKGSHIKLRASGRATIILPGDRKNLSPGVIRSVATALGYTGIHDLQKDLGL